MAREEQMTSVTPEEIIHLILEEMEAGMCPSYYSNLVPSTYDVYLNANDLERLRPLEPRIREEASRALAEKLVELNRAGEPKLRLPLMNAKRNGKRYESLGEWSVALHENLEEDAAENPLVIHSTFPFATGGGDDRAGTLTERVTRRSSGGQLTTTATVRGAAADTSVDSADTQSTVSTAPSSSDATKPVGATRATIDYQDDTGAHAYLMTKDQIKVGRGGVDRWVDLKLNSKKDVSREHLQIRRDAATGQFFIKDLSTLGTTVNGKRIPASIEQVSGEDVDKKIEVPLPAKARIGLAGVVYLDFRSTGK